MITVQDLATHLHLEVLCEGDLTREVRGGYCGDLLSWVMGRAPAGSAWISVMGNVNAIAVCVLADLPCLILCENATLDDAAHNRAALESVTVLRSPQDSYSLAVALSRLLSQ